jgi:hypothetical protein
MKQFFEQCLRDLEALTGKRQVYYWQTETDTDSTGKAKGARKFEVCVQGMVIQSQNFPYIPEEDQKRIITEMIVKDQDYEALNSSVIYKWLAMYKDKYFMAANAPEPEPMHQHTPEELERIDKLAQEYLAQLAGAFQPSFKGIEKDMEAIKRQDKQRVEMKGSGYLPSSEKVMMSELRRVWMLENFDPMTGKKNDNYLSFDEWILL